MDRKRLTTAVRWFAAANFVFLLGVAFAMANSGPLNGMSKMVGSLYDRLKLSGTGDWFFIDIDRRGVLRHDPEKANGGYTLVVVCKDMEVNLIDMNGRPVHSWEIPSNTGFSGWMEGMRTAFGLLQPHVDTAQLYPNGDLLVVYGQPAIGKYGSSVTKLDKDSNVLWRYINTSHHTVRFWNDRIYVVTQDQKDPDRTHPVKALRGLRYLDDRITVLDGNGVELATYSIVDMMMNTPGLDVNAIFKGDGAAMAATLHGDAKSDPLHANDLEIITDKTAPLVPNAKPGDVLISIKHANMVVLADLADRKIGWILRGHFSQQHDIDVLPNGHFMVFDNYGNISNAGRSRVLELDANGAIVWSYEGSEIDPLYSDNRGSQQRLANGNTLIAEANGGRIIEVTPEKDVVWEYLHPVRAVEDGKPLIASLALDIERYDYSYVEFLQEVRREAAR